MSRASTGFASRTRLSSAWPSCCNAMQSRRSGGSSCHFSARRSPSFAQVVRATTLSVVAWSAGQHCSIGASLSHRNRGCPTSWSTSTSICSRPSNLASPGGNGLLHGSRRACRSLSATRRTMIFRLMPGHRCSLSPVGARCWSGKCVGGGRRVVAGGLTKSACHAASYALQFGLTWVSGASSTYVGLQTCHLRLRRSPGR